MATPKELMQLIRVLYIDGFARVVKILASEECGEIERYALTVDGDWVKIEQEFYPNTTKLSIAHTNYVINI